MPIVKNPKIKVETFTDVDGVKHTLAYVPHPMFSDKKLKKELEMAKEKNNVKQMNPETESEEKEQLRKEASQLFDKVVAYQTKMQDLDQVRKMSQVQQVLTAAQLNIMVCHYEIMTM